MSIVVRNDVLRFAKRLLDYEHVPYDPAYQVAAHQCLVDDLQNLPDLAHVLAAVGSGDVDYDRPERGEIRAMVHSIGLGSANALTVVRIKGLGIATQRAKGWRALVAREGVYVQATDEILYYESSFDLLLAGSTAYVLRPTTIQEGLGSSERAKKLAATTFAKVTSNLLISGMSDLEKAARSQPAMIAKMASIARTLETDPEYIKLLTMDRLVDFLAENPQIDIPVLEVDSKKTLVFEPHPQRRFAIIKLIADDYLESALSGRHYEAGSKLAKVTPSRH